MREHVTFKNSVDHQCFLNSFDNVDNNGGQWDREMNDIRLRPHRQYFSVGSIKYGHGDDELLVSWDFLTVIKIQNITSHLL